MVMNPAGSFALRRELGSRRGGILRMRGAGFVAAGGVCSGEVAGDGGGGGGVSSACQVKLL